jgi:hypothetical protein
VSPLAIGVIVLACVFGGALLGTLLRARLPEHHLSEESKDVVKLAMGLIATMSALVLGLLIASAKSSYDAQTNELKQVSTSIILLDRVMARYGPEAKGARELLRRSVVDAIDRAWPATSSPPALLDPAAEAQDLYDAIHALSPQNEAQSSLRSRALGISSDIAQMRWLLFEQRTGSIPLPFLVVLIWWIAIIFASFGLFAPPNASVIAILFICALSVSAAIVLILELDQPFGGFLQISSAPLRDALGHLGQ